MTDREVDIALRYPAGRAAKLAKQGLLPFIKLPDGAIRFDVDDIEHLLSIKIKFNGPAVEVANA